ncbi:MAG: DUF6768 family protein [Hyphomonadaceae bacterium]
MSNLDRAIREALSKEDAEFLARFEDHSTPVGAALETFRGRWALMNGFAALITFVLFGGFLYFVWRMLSAGDVRDVVLWSVAAVLAMLGVAMLKMYFWMEMNKNAVLREVKRLELQVARLATRDAI